MSKVMTDLCISCFGWMQLTENTIEITSITQSEPNKWSGLLWQNTTPPTESSFVGKIEKLLSGKENDNQDPSMLHFVHYIPVIENE